MPALQQPGTAPMPPRMPPETKTAIIQRHMAGNDWRKAVAQAARLPQLGPHRAAILDAHNAYVRPAWVRQMRRDPDALIAAGIAALRDKFGGRRDA